MVSMSMIKLNLGKAVFVETFKPINGPTTLRPVLTKQFYK